MAIMSVVAAGGDGGSLVFSIFLLVFVAAVLVGLYFVFRVHITACGRLMGCAATALSACPGVVGSSLLCMLCFLG